MRPALRHLSRACTVLLALAGLTACVADPGAPGYGRAATAAPSGPPAVGRRVAILLPLTGPSAEVGQALLKAAQLSLGQPGAPPLDSQDTGGTPDGAATAARAAVAGGAGLILGPLTTGETAAVAPIARGAGVPVLAFTSDAAQAQPGVWTLGITPAQQIRRLVLAVQAENKSRIAAVLPQNVFADALNTGLLNATSAAGMPAPRVLRYTAGFSGAHDALKTISAFDSRRGAIEAEQRAARASSDAETRKTAAEIGRKTPAAPPMDALLLGTSGDPLLQLVPLLAFYDIGPDQVRILGPALWARDASRLGAIAGAWYAGPDPALRAPFEQQFTARYNAPARDFTSLAFDAAGVARVVATPSGFNLGALTRAEGFAGADGLFALQPDGSVRRGLAIFEIDRGGAHVVQPAPQAMSAPGV